MFFETVGDALEAEGVFDGYFVFYCEDESSSGEGSVEIEIMEELELGSCA